MAWRRDVHPASARHHVIDDHMLACFFTSLHPAWAPKSPDSHLPRSLVASPIHLSGMFFQGHTLWPLQTRFCTVTTTSIICRATSQALLVSVICIIIADVCLFVSQSPEVVLIKTNEVVYRPT